MSWDWKPLLVIGVCAMGAAPAPAAADQDWDHARQVNVELSNFDFTPIVRRQNIRHNSRGDGC